MAQLGAPARGRPGEAHERAGNWDRLNAILRFLFAAVRIDGPDVGGPKLDYGRISIEQNDI